MCPGDDRAISSKQTVNIDFMSIGSILLHAPRLANSGRNRFNARIRSVEEIGRKCARHSRPALWFVWVVRLSWTKGGSPSTVKSACPQVSTSKMFQRALGGKLREYKQL